MISKIIQETSKEKDQPKTRSNKILENEVSLTNEFRLKFINCDKKKAL